MSAKTTNILQKFFKYLSGLGISPKSHKNYRSDISHFSKWFLIQVRQWGVATNTFSDTLPFLNQVSGKNYKTYLTTNKVANKTINRRLSTLRHLSRFLISSQILDFNFMEGITNISKASYKQNYPLLPLFEKHLNTAKASRNTVRNYVNDVRQFLSWAESKNLQSHTNNN